MIYDKKIRVSMKDGTNWIIPIKIIADSHATYYSGIDNVPLDSALKENTIPLFSEDGFEIMDWAQNNMNWEEIEPFAEKISAPEQRSYKEQWNEVGYDDWCIL